MGQLTTVASFDGWIDREYEPTWTAARDTASGENVDHSGGSNIVRNDGGDINTIMCGRTYQVFDLSTIPASATITSASLAVNCAGTDAVTEVQGAVKLVESTQASPTDLVVSDYSKRGSTSFANDIDCRTTGTKTFTINGDGITYLQSVVGSNAMLCLLSKRDFDNTSPGPSPLLGLVYIAGRADGTPASRPTLTVNYTVPGGVRFVNFT